MIYEIITQFKSTKPKKTVFGNYRIEGNELLYRAQVSEEFKANKDTLPTIIKRTKDGAKLSLKPNYGPTVPLSLEELTARVDGNEWTKVLLTDFKTNTIAKKLTVDGKEVLLGNGSILPLIGRKVAYGNVTNNSSETEIQKHMQRNNFIMIPFSVFEAAKLNVEKYKLIEQGVEETFKIKKENPRYCSWDDSRKKLPKFIVEPRHFVGASLFEVEGQCFLFDVDRREIKNKIFNPFLVKLTKKVKSIEEAYQSLKPKEVLQAEKQGKKVLRQGEWFFVPCKTPKLPKLSARQVIETLMTMIPSWADSNSRLKYIAKGYKKNQKLLESIPQKLEIKAGNNRPNSIEMGFTKDGETFATGKVNHSGREHAELKLQGWYKVYSNTSIGSFTLTGDVD